MLSLNRTLEEFLDDATLLLRAPEFLDYEDWDLEQDLRNEVVLCESTAAIVARMRLATPREAWPLQLPAKAIRQDEVQPWEV